MKLNFSSTALDGQTVTLTLIQNGVTVARIEFDYPSGIGDVARFQNISVRIF